MLGLKVAALALCLFGAAAGASFAQAPSRPPPVQGRYQGALVVQKINDHIYWARGPSTSNNSNNAFIIGKTSVLLFDTKNTVDDEKNLLAEIAKITNKPIKTVFISHSDGDHINGLPALPKGLTIYAHDYAANVMRASAAKGGERAASPDYLPTKTFKTKESLTIDGVKLQLLNWGPAHIGGDLVLYIPADKIVFMGDIVISEIAEPFLHMDNGGSPAGAIKAIKGMIALNADTYVSRHGDIVDKAELSRRLAAYEAKAARVNAMIAEGKTLADIKAAVGDPPPPAPGGRGMPTLTDYLFQEASKK